VLRVPLAELVAEREDPLLRPGLLLVPPRAADAGVEAVLGDGVEERHRLVPVPRLERVREHHLAGADRVLDGPDDEPLAELRRAAIPEGDHLGVVVAGVHVQEREGEAGRPERLLGEPEQADRVLAPGEQEHRVRALSGDLAEDVDRLRFEPVEVGERLSVRERHGAMTSPRAAVGACRPAHGFWMNFRHNG
jgi:hypothetical protein